MKKLIVLLQLFLFSQQGFAQTVAIQLDKMNILYTCIENPLTVIVANVPCSKLVLTTDNGLIKKDTFGVEGHYSIYPSKVGTATITVSKKTANGIKEIRSLKYRVKQTPLPYVKCCGKHGGEVFAQVFRAGPGITTKGHCYDMYPWIHIIQVTIIVTRGNIEIFRKTIYDNHEVGFEVSRLPFFQTLRVGDVVSFTDMKGKTCELEPRELEPIEMKLK